MRILGFHGNAVMKLHYTYATERTEVAGVFIVLKYAHIVGHVSWPEIATSADEKRS